MILHQVITAEKVPFTYRVAGIGSRFLAWLLDALLIIVLWVAGAMFLSILDILRPGLGSAVTRLWLFALTWGYFLLFEWLWLGQTPGKRVLGIRVIQERGTRIAFLHAAVRNVVRFVDALPVFYGVGFGVMICDTKQRRLGDWAAGTLVVHVERSARPILALHEGSAERMAQTDMVLRQRLGQLGREQQQTLLDLCLRRDQLRLNDRAQLFRAVAEYLHQELDLTPERHQSDEKFVVALADQLGTARREERA